MPSYDAITNNSVTDLEYTLKTFDTNGYLSVWDSNSNLNVFQLNQFHFHAPSEHTINESHFDLELHIVHKATSGLYSVVGLFFDRSAGNTNNSLISSLNLESVNATVPKIPLMDLLKGIEDKKFFQY